MDLDLIRGIDLFKNLDAVQLAHLAQILERVEYKTGETLFKEGDEPDFFYIIQSGRVRISKFVSGFGEEALAILDPNSYFGEMELLEPTLPRAAHATIHQNCVLQRLNIKEFFELLNSDLELAMAVLWSVSRTLSMRLRATDDKIAAMFAMASFS